MRQLIIMGPQGSGKGTQAKLLARDLDIDHISTGEMFRWHMSQNTPLSARIRSHMQAANLVPDDVVEEVVRERLGRTLGKRGFVLDGFPRTLPQSKFFLEHFRVDRVILLEITDDLVKKRILGRRRCPRCHEDYNVFFSPPEREGICDECHSTLESRADDIPQAIERRLSAYHQWTEPVIKLFEEQGVVLKVAADGPGPLVHESILKGLGLADGGANGRDAS